ncbi:hypothetical protein J6590_093619, partial [Homalodisca vitripennis]
MPATLRQVSTGGEFQHPSPPQTPSSKPLTPTPKRTRSSINISTIMWKSVPKARSLN